MNRLHHFLHKEGKQFRRIVFWQNMPSHHQAETLQALAQKGYSILWCVNELLLPDRAQAGWSSSQARGVDIKVVGNCAVQEIKELIDPRDLHVFSPRGTSAGYILLREALRGNISYAFLGEKPTGKGLKLAYSWLVYALLARVLPAPKFFLAMGETGADFYHAVGFKSTLPFWYTVSASTNYIDENPRNHGHYRFIIVSRLIRRKRVDLALDAFSKLSAHDWTLQIIGDGPEKDKLVELSRMLGISRKVVFSGAMPAIEVRKHINHSDTLLLPSEWEGWGAVINESIAEGTRFIASDNCGSHCLIGLSAKCTAFKANNESGLISELKQHIHWGPVSSIERAARRDIHQKISGASAADYFSQILDGQIPNPPWI